MYPLTKALTKAATALKGRANWWGNVQAVPLYQYSVRSAQMPATALHQKKRTKASALWGGVPDLPLPIHPQIHPWLIYTCSPLSFPLPLRQSVRQKIDFCALAVLAAAKGNFAVRS